MSSKFKRGMLYFAGLVILLLILRIFFRPHGEILNKSDFSQIVYDRDGKVLRLTLSPDEKFRLYKHLENFGKDLKEAVLLKEDQYFYYHPGVNLFSIFRAFYQTYFSDGQKIGGSTITMQLARLKYGLKTRTVWGKIKQIFSAFYLEIYYSKNDIFEAYLNSVPCGGNIEGYATASLIYFEKDTPELSVEEILFLSVLPQSPSSFNPKVQHYDKNILAARERLFDIWAKLHPDNQSIKTHLDMPLNINYNIPFLAPHFTTSLLESFPNTLKIYTTLNVEIQNKVERITKRYLKRNKAKGVNNAVVMLVNAENMEVIASLGSADFFNDAIEGQVDGTLARRSPGSTLKPFIYGLAMEQGLIHPMTMLKDAPVSFSEYAPDNYERDFKGPIKAWEALITSRNIPAVTLASKLEELDLYDFLKTLKIGDLKSKEYYGLSIVLGSAELSMKELVQLYGVLKNNGTYRELSSVFSSYSEKKKSSETPLSPAVCYVIKEILNKNPRPHSNAYIAKQDKKTVAYKTGTSIGFKDCWSIGMFDNYILAVWLGNFNGAGNPHFIGRELATPLMFEIAETLDSDSIRNNQYFDIKPETVTEIEVCAVSGQIASTNCAKRITTLYIPGKSPISKCDICRAIYVDRKTGYRTLNKDGHHVKKQIFEFWPTDILALYKKAGIPRKVPPSFEPNANLNVVSTLGLAPQIVSPASEVKYQMQPQEDSFNNLPLKAVFDADVREAYWYVNQKFIGRTEPDQIQYWSLQPGTFNISVVDDHGRSDSKSVLIEVAAN